MALRHCRERPDGLCYNLIGGIGGCGDLRGNTQPMQLWLVRHEKASSTSCPVLHERARLASNPPPPLPLTLAGGGSSTPAGCMQYGHHMPTPDHAGTLWLAQAPLHAGLAW